MQENNQMTRYKISFWDKIKKGIRKLFFKNKEIKIYNNKKEIKEEKISKEEVIETYRKIKEGIINIDDLEENLVHKILLLMNEEIKINNQRIKEKIDNMRISLYNIEMYNKEIEVLKKNS